MLPRSSTFPLADEALILKEWNEEVHSLVTMEELEQYLANVKDVKSFTGYVQAVEKTINETNKSSRSFKVAKWIKPIFKTMNMIAPLVQDYAPIDPRISGIILGAISNALAVSSKFINYQESLEAQIAKMASKLDLVGQYSDTIFPKDVGLHRTMSKVYAVILKFCVDASRLFVDEMGKKKTSILRVGKSAWESFESRFGKIDKEFDSRLVDLNLAIGLCRDRAIEQLGHRQDLLLDFANQTKSLEQKHEKLHRIEETKQIEKQQRDKWERLLDRLTWHSFDEVQEERFPKLIEGTGEWLNNLEEFQKWRAQPKSSLLWVHGKNGSGKSFVACRVIEDLRIACEATRGAAENEKNMVALAYVYCSSLVSGDSEPKRLLGSIFKQLLEQLPARIDIPRLYETLGNKHEPPTIGNIRSGIRILANWFSQTFLVFDGLDECSWSERTLIDARQVKSDSMSFKELCDFIASLSKATSGMTSFVKTIVFSRPKYSQIESSFANSTQISADTGRNESDIKEYISETTENLTPHKEILEKIMRKLLDGSDGMFLWVKLVVSALRDCYNAKEMEAAIEKLPQSLEKVYHWSLERIMQQPHSIARRSIKAIMWITNAKRPISKEEMKQILAIENGMMDWDESCVPVRDGGELVVQCGDLITTVNDQYHVIHLSLREFLVESSLMMDFLKSSSLIKTSTAHAMAETCLVFLNFENFNCGPAKTMSQHNKLMETHAFLHYAPEYWAAHMLDVSEVASKDLDSLALRLIASDNKRNLVAQLRLRNLEESYLFPGSCNLLYFLSMFGIVRLAESFSDISTYLNEYDLSLGMPIDYALWFNNHEMTLWLLKEHLRVGKINVDPQILKHRNSRRLCFFALKDWGDAIEIFTKLEHDINERDSFDLTPLNIAAMYGSATALDALLAADADINTVDLKSFDMQGKTPLIRAIERGYDQMAQKLLDYGADVRVKARGQDAGLTALHYAAVQGNIPLMHAIITRGADINALASTKESPLYLAILASKSDAVKLLLENHADFSSPDYLLAAAANSCEKCLQLLLDSGADIKAVDNRGENVVHIAARSGNIKCLQMLKNYNALFEVQNIYGLTPFHNAVLHGNFRVALDLVDDFQCDPKSSAHFGANALHLMADGCTEEQDLVFLDFLIEAKIDIDSRMMDDSSILHVAARSNNRIYTKAILGKFPTLARVLQKDGTSPIHDAALCGSADVVELLLSYDDYLRDIQDSFSQTPLGNAALKGHVGCTELLLTTRNVNSRGYRGRTPLINASFGANNLATVELLLKNGAEIDTKDENGMTALIGAISKGHSQVYGLLIDKGANPRIVDNFGKSALFWAVTIGDQDLIQRLLNLGCETLILHQTSDKITPFSQAVLLGFCEVIDIFLQYAHGVRDLQLNSFIPSLIPVSVLGGFNMYKKLRILDAKPTLNVDYSGLDLMHHAAKSGDSLIILDLVELGHDVEGLGLGRFTPLHHAVLMGSLGSVDTLLELGADVNAVSTLPWSESPLHMAKKFPRITARLLEAGGNINAVALMNSTPFWIADPHVQTILKIFAKNASHLTKRRTHIDTRGVICEILLWILEPPKPLVLTVHKASSVRLECLGALSQALLHLKTPRGLLEATMVSAELLSKGFHPQCCVCKTLYSVTYRCIECPRNFICSYCHLDSITTGGFAILSDGLRLVEVLETKTYAFRYVCQVITFHPLLFPVLRSCVSFLQLDNTVWRCFTDKMEHYEYLEKTYNTQMQFGQSRTLGQLFLNLLQIATRVGSGVEEPGSEMKRMQYLIKTLYNNITRDRELEFFVCHGHKYVKVPSVSEISEAYKPSFGSEGMLTDQYFLSMYQHYQTSLSSNLPLEQQKPSFSSTRPSPIVPLEAEAKLHWTEDEEAYILRVAENFDILENMRSHLRLSCTRFFDRSVRLKDILLISIYWAETSNPSVLSSKEYSSIVIGLGGIELAWQLTQIALVGYVSEPLFTVMDSSMDLDPESRYESLFLEFKVLDDYETSLQQSPEDAEIDNAEYIAAESKLLKKLPEKTRRHIINFVRKAREKRKNPVSIRSRNAMLKAASEGSLVAGIRLMFLSMTKDMPFHVYDFYSNTLLTRMILRPESQGEGPSSSVSENVPETLPGGGKNTEKGKNKDLADG